MNYSGYLTKEFYVVDVQDGAVSVPSPFLSITCLSKSFYDLDAWALTHLTFAVPSSIDGLSSLFLSWCFSTNHASHTSLFILSILCVYLFILWYSLFLYCVCIYPASAHIPTYSTSHTFLCIIPVCIFVHLVIFTLSLLCMCIPSAYIPTCSTSHHSYAYACMYLFI